MPRYTRELLFNTIVPRDNCKIFVDKLSDKLQAKSIIPYLCECGTAAEKRFDTIHDKGGAYCPPCVKKNLSAKLKARVRGTPLSQIKGDASLAYNVEQEDGVTYGVDLETELTLVIPPAILRPKICGPHTKSSKHPNSIYHSVSYWDFDTLTVKSKSFPITAGCIDARLDAEELHEEQITVAEKYKDNEFKISVAQLLEKPQWYSKNFRLASTVKEYPSRPVPFPAFIGGAWLGDGSSNSAVITSVDQEILDEFKSYADTIGVRFALSSGIQYRLYCNDGDKSNKFVIELQRLNMYGNKHVPDIFIKNSKEVRLDFLAGILDTDGHLSNSKNGGGSFELIQKREAIFDGVRKIVKSLGMSMSKTKCIKTVKHKGKVISCRCFRGYIGGSAERLAEIPTRLPRKKFIPKKRARYDLIRFKLVPRDEEDEEEDDEMDDTDEIDELDIIEEVEGLRLS